MAKDGTNRGGARPGAGAKRKPLSDKILEGNAGKRKITVLTMPQSNNFDTVSGNKMPSPNKLLRAKQKDGRPFEAAKIYKITWEWLEKRGCSELISPQLIERYAMSMARWIQCEQEINENGLLGQHPTTGAPIASPYVSIGQTYMSQANRLWMEIFQVVKDNCVGEFNSAPHDDIMEHLLLAKESC